MEAAQPQQAPAGLLRRIFTGREGLRAGWSLLLFCGIAGLLISAAHFTAIRIHPPRPHPAGVPHVPSVLGDLLNGSVMVVILLVASWIMAKVEGRTLGEYGFGGPRKAGLALRGAFWGFAGISLLVLALRATGHLAFEGRLLGPGAALGYALIWTFGFLLVGFNEEFLMRGYLQFTLARGLGGLAAALGVHSERARKAGFWTAAFLLSCLFGLGHGGNQGETTIGLIAAGLAGLMFCLSLYRTGSLWWAMGFHAAWDWGQSYFYGTADSGTFVRGHLLGSHPAGAVLWSGGTVGPEGSLLVLPMLILAGAVILMTLKRPEGYPG